MVRRGHRPGRPADPRGNGCVGRTRPSSKELAVGRRLANGAPLTGRKESDEPDLGATVGGIPVIPPTPTSHLPGTAPKTSNSSAALQLRRSPGSGRTTDSGLIFASYQSDPDATVRPRSAATRGCRCAQPVDHHDRIGHLRDSARGPHRGRIPGTGAARLPWMNSRWARRASPDLSAAGPTLAMPGKDTE